MHIFTNIPDRLVDTMLAALSAEISRYYDGMSDINLENMLEAYKLLSGVDFHYLNGKDWIRRASEAENNNT